MLHGRAAGHRHGRSTEAGIRDILESAVRPPQRLRLGMALTEPDHRFAVAARHTAAFQAADVKLIDPWGTLR